MKRSGIPASIKMAQACLESSNGNSELSQKSNNHFGIKCKSNWTGKTVLYDDDHRNECFRKYKSVEDSYRDHTNFLVGNPRYAELFALAPDDYESWAKGLKKCGYATAPNYANLLIKIIEENQLYRLDYNIPNDELLAYNNHRIGSSKVNHGITINPFQNHQVRTVNKLKAVVARKGDTFEIIAQELDMKAWELYKFNDHRKGYRPQPGEIVYIQQKRRKTSKNQPTHIVQEGETMHYISQLYGIRLNPLYRRNDLKVGQQPAVSEVVQLRKKI